MECKGTHVDIITPAKRFNFSCTVQIHPDIVITIE